MITILLVAKILDESFYRKKNTTSVKVNVNEKKNRFPKRRLSLLVARSLWDIQGVGKLWCRSNFIPDIFSIIMTVVKIVAILEEITVFES